MWKSSPVSRFSRPRLFSLQNRMEQWHQKLHNNTTPDDVAICEAYLNFLDSGGDAGAYWATLSDAGIVRR